MTTGTVMPRMSLVASLKRCTNWPMLTPCWPSAGPTGGAGVACPPGHCSLIWAFTSRAIVPSSTQRQHAAVSRDSLPADRCVLATERSLSDLFHLIEVQLHVD